MRQLTARLWAIGTKRPSPATRAEVDAALASKWEGVQAVAAAVLGKWGDRQSVEKLRTLLIDCCTRKAAWAIRTVVVGALRPVITDEDADWILDIYFELGSWMLKREIFELVTALPPARIRARLVGALHDARCENRQAAVNAIGFMNYPDCRELLLPLRNDTSAEVRRSVRLLTEGTDGTRQGSVRKRHTSKSSGSQRRPGRVR